MRTITATELRQKLGEILDAASAGESILIERDHKPLAYLVSVEEGATLGESREEIRERRMAALDRIDEFAKRMAIEHPAQPGDLTAADWVRWDRDHRDDRHKVREDDG